MRLFDLRYRDERGVETTRTIEPQFLYLNPPVWYLLALIICETGFAPFALTAWCGPACWSNPSG
jgi:predicted DNA-binding transcriptional regulator YafY